jgi:hypothetical protein
VQQKLETRAFEHVAPLFYAGEQPVVASRAMVGKFSSGRLGAVAGQSLRLEVGALGTLLAKSSKQFVVLTNYRFIFLPQTMLGGPGKKVLGELPRDQVSLVEVKMGMVSLLRLAFATPGDGVALTFPRQDKKNAESLAMAMGYRPGG